MDKTNADNSLPFSCKSAAQQRKIKEKLSQRYIILEKRIVQVKIRCYGERHTAKGQSKTRNKLKEYDIQNTVNEIDK